MTCRYIIARAHGRYGISGGHLSSVPVWILYPMFWTGILQKNMILLEGLLGLPTRLSGGGLFYNVFSIQTGFRMQANTHLIPEWSTWSIFVSWCWLQVNCQGTTYQLGAEHFLFAGSIIKCRLVKILFIFIHFEEKALSYFRIKLAVQSMRLHVTMYFL